MREGVIKRTADRFLPYIDKCVICGVEKGVDEHLCIRCREKLEEAEHGEAYVKGYEAYCAYDYEGYARKIVRNFKYNDSRYLAMFMAQKMAKGVPQSCSCITYVPLHDKRRKQRGFDQAELLAKQVSQITGIPFVKAAVRIKNTQTQTKLDLKQREENMAGAFKSVSRVSGNVVLVDDVLTTGATAGECANVLTANGADEVLVLTFAKAIGEKQKKRFWFINRWFALL